MPLMCTTFKPHGSLQLVEIFHLWLQVAVVGQSFNARRDKLLGQAQRPLPPSRTLSFVVSGIKREFCRQHGGMLFPAFTLQRRVRSKIVSEAFWKVTSCRCCRSETPGTRRDPW